MKFVIAVIIFSVVILIHELGHFLLAKNEPYRGIGIFSWYGTQDHKYGKGRHTLFRETVSSWRFLRHGRRGCGR